jgi:FkbM family methyltransferase
VGVDREDVGVTAADLARAHELRSRLRHHDPSQLWFQLTEIVAERGYVRHGVEVEPGMTVLDVGANVGVTAAFFALECQAGVVHSFEPVAPVYELLRQNLDQFPACVTHPYGLSDRNASAEITYYPGATAMSGLYADPTVDRELVHRAMANLGMSESETAAALEGRYRPETLRCELRPLSQVIATLGLDRIDLLKIDVEKAELDVLRGIAHDDWAKVEQIVVEVHDQDGRLGLVERMLRERGLEVTTDQGATFVGTPVHVVYAVRP